MTTTTTFDEMCDILGEFWVEYKGDPNFEDFVSYNDLGLPLAYAVTTDIVGATDKAKAFIKETFDMLLDTLGIEDTGFEGLDSVLHAASEK